jgi:hypothetical protein
MSRSLPHHLFLVLDLLRARPPPLLPATPASPCLLASALPPPPVPVPPVCVAAPARPIHNQPRARFTLGLHRYLKFRLPSAHPAPRDHGLGHGALRPKRDPLILGVRPLLLRACWSRIPRTQDYRQVARHHGAVVPTSAGSTPESPDALLVGGLLASLRPRTVARVVFPALGVKAPRSAGATVGPGKSGQIRAFNCFTGLSCHSTATTSPYPPDIGREPPCLHEEVTP